MSNEAPKLIHARLTLDVVYQPNGTPVSALLTNLQNIPELASIDGLMSGNTEAYVESWEANAVEIPDAAGWFVTEILLHDIEWNLRGDDAPELLGEAEVDHIRYQIMEGYREGELVVTGMLEQEYRGWWRIKK